MVLSTCLQDECVFYKWLKQGPACGEQVEDRPTAVPCSLGYHQQSLLLSKEHRRAPVLSCELPLGTRTVKMSHAA